MRKGFWIDTLRFKAGARQTIIGMIAIGLFDSSSSSRFLFAEGLKKKERKERKLTKERSEASSRRRKRSGEGEIAAEKGPP
jgi:hypothetical protein